ncbi:unnamed protein product, partial [Iphiclides podalirius]
MHRLHTNISRVVHEGKTTILAFLSPSLHKRNNMNIAPVGPEPSSLVCPSCHATIVSRVERKATTRTHLIALGLCVFLCWCCVCLPYCMNSCQNADHYCPNCNAYLGTYSS